MQLEGERRRAMEGVLDHATCVLVTLEEGIAITGQTTATGVANWFFDRPGGNAILSLHCLLNGRHVHTNSVSMIMAVTGTERIVIRVDCNGHGQ
eukprot:scaffold675347_cov46-Prasinocladus_malaysianus.AAC.1